MEAVDISRMDREICPTEIQNAIFNIVGMKAPGVNGFPGLFFQQHRPLCAKEVNEVISQAFHCGKIPSGLNHSLITLVPKTQSPQYMHLLDILACAALCLKLSLAKIIESRISH